MRVALVLLAVLALNTTKIIRRAKKIFINQFSDDCYLI